jgi:hypothetical protein
MVVEAYAWGILLATTIVARLQIPIVIYPAMLKFNSQKCGGVCLVK